MTAPTDPNPDLGPLRLKAVEKADLEVISAMLQDALLPVMDMAFQPAESRFVAVANRFRWERRGETQRVLCALRIDHAKSVRIKGFARTDRSKILNLLNISLSDHNSTACLRLIFAGGAEIEIVADALALKIEDYGEPWPAQSAPRHGEAASS